MLIGIELDSCTITVSGFPPIIAVTVIRDGQTILTVQSGAFQMQTTYATGVVRPMQHLRQTWCARCKRLVPGANAMDGRLGFRGYCGECVEDLASQTLRKYGRLPIVGQEFVCPACVVIKPMDQLTSPEADGRRRLRCRECRLGQLRRARLKRLKRLM